MNTKGKFLIQFNGVGAQMVCLQAAYAGEDAPISIAPVDPAGTTPLQQWSLGDDGRIYLFTAAGNEQFCVDFPQPPQNGQPLLLSLVQASDSSQQWQFHGDSNMSTLTNVGLPSYAIDNDGGGLEPGNRVQVWQVSNNTNQAWIFAVIPTLL